MGTFGLLATSRAVTIAAFPGKTCFGLNKGGEGARRRTKDSELLYNTKEFVTNGLAVLLISMDKF